MGTKGTNQAFELRKGWIFSLQINLICNFQMSFE